MSLFDSASLVVTPNGTKASKLYAIKPTDGSGDLVVTRATTATRVNSSGLIESVATNVPRLDYTNSTCPSILVEPQRTNSQKYSEDLSNGSNYSTGNASISTNQTTSPDGNNTADKLVESNTNARHELYTSPLTYSGTTAISFFAKVAGRRYLACFLGGNPSKGGAIFDLQSGVVSLTSGGTNATIQNFGDGWYRCSFTSTLTGSSSLYTCLRTNASIVDVQTYLGDGTSGVYIWGMQQELTSTYPTSYIPTIASSVTRNADVISKTGISSLIGQTEGTLFYDGFYGNEINEVYLFLQKEISTGVEDSIYIQQSAARIALNVYFGATQQVFIVDGAFTVGQRIKIAAGYKNNDFVLYVNGVQIGTDNSGSVPTCGALQFASYRGAPTTSNFIANKGCKISALWKTRLSNTELASLTTI